MSVEAYVKNLKSEKWKDNYAEAAKRAASQFSAMDTEAMARKLSLDLDEKYVYIPFMGEKCRIQKENGEVSVMGADGSYSAAESFNLPMVLYDLLAFSVQDAVASGEYTQIQNLADTTTSRSYAGQGMFHDTEIYLSGKEEKLEKALIKMGGEKYGKGDMSYKIHLFRDLYAVISFWSADDEFPASLNIFFDKNMKQFMHYETIWYVAMLITDALKKNMEQVS